MNEQTIIDAYLNTDDEIDIICKTYNVSESKLYCILRQNDIKRRNMKWTNDMIREEAKKYEYKSDWQKSNPVSYTTALRRKIMEECSKHMKIKPNCYTSDMGVIYAYIFTDNHAYIGLSVVPHKRHAKHKTEGPVFEHAKICPTYERLILEDKIPFSDMVIREQHYMDLYRGNGYILLNSVGAGSRGSISNKRWTVSKLLEESKKYKTRAEWKEKSNASHLAATRTGNIDMFCTHMERLKRQDWSEISVLEEARKYENVSQWQKNSKSSYNWALKYKILDKCKEHMKPLHRMWTNDDVMLDAKKYSTISEWSTNSNAYEASKRMGIFEDATKHMNKDGYKNRTDEEIILDASQYESRKSWIANSRTVYCAAHRRKILHLCIHKPNNSNFERNE